LNIGLEAKGPIYRIHYFVALEKCVIEFVDLIERYNTGEVKEMEWQ